MKAPPITSLKKQIPSSRRLEPETLRPAHRGGLRHPHLPQRKCPQLPGSAFSGHRATLDGRDIRYRLADKGVYIGHGPRRARRRLHLRQVTRLGEDGHQTPVLTSRTDLSAIEVAHRMFERWRQENFFKYLREEYALDALVDYGAEAADPTRSVPNPERKTINAERSAAYAELNALAAEYGLEAMNNPLITP